MSNEIPLSFSREKNLSGMSGGRSFNRLKVPKNGSVVVRILPPYGTNNQGALYSKYTVHWGFMDAEQSPRPVACSYPSERYCPVCDMVRKAKSELEELKRQGVETGNRYEQLKKTVETFDSKTFFLFNVVDLADGEVKMLELPKTAVSGRGREISPNSLLGKITEAIDKRKFDPVSLTTGVWFEISRNGEGINTVYSVDFNRIIKTDADGNEVEALNKTALDESTVNKVKAQIKGDEGPMYDIHSMYEERTSLQLKSFIDGAPVPSKSKKATEQSSSSEPEDDFPSDPVPSKATAKPAPLHTPAPVDSGSGDVQSEIQRLREKAKLKAQSGS
jgi:hypothetical protein